MKKTAIITALTLFALPLFSFAGEFKDRGDTIAVDFPAAWSVGKSDDPTVTLKLEKGKGFFEFSKQDSELGDYYLKARVKEQVDSLRSKGTSLSGEVRPVSIHGVTTAYYTSYESMGSQAYMAFFTYNSASYAVSVHGMSDAEFRSVIASVRKPGEKIVLPKPKRVKVLKKRVTEKDPDETGDVDISTAAGSAEEILSAFAQASSETASGAEVSTQAAQGPAETAAQNFMQELAKKQEGDTGKPPYLPRGPLPALYCAILIGLWIAGSFVARSVASAYQNPKLPPPPTEVPPDFFFPFMISRSSTAKDVVYQVVTRQRQRLMAEYVSEHEVFIAAAVYGCVFFHIAWSMLGAAGSGDAVVNVLLKVPLLGRALASFPEVVFLLPLVMGLSAYFTKKPALQLYDAQNTLVLEVKPEIEYGLIRDGNGKEIARLAKKGTFMYRYWEFVDTDNLVVFAIRDDFPKGYLLRKLFGNLGGALRSRYGIFVQDRRAGFIFLDPSSADRFQIHMDYSFARLGHPAHILSAVLYVISKEADPIYPSPF
jgi:hypothetical protein